MVTRWPPEDLHDHGHGRGEDHDHDQDGVDDEPVEANPIWQQDNVTLRSVGIDIGSSGTQVVFSQLHLRRLGEDLTSRYVVVRRETLFQSEIHLTPYADETRIDTAALGLIIDGAYQDGRQRPKDIDTGVVILTGEALRRRNAERIAKIVSEQAGDLVCASAGHHMEAMLAGFGSGAARVSHDQGNRILNVDIGGGTTKLGLIDRGRVVATAAIHVGGRLQVMDPDGRIVRLDPAGRNLAESVGCSWSLGDRVEPSDLDRVAEWMADAIVLAASGGPLPDQVAQLFLTDPIVDSGGVDAIMFSGGVAEYVYGRESRDFGDIGRRLGEALRDRIEQGLFPAPVLPGGECIRATVLGASEYSVQLSGNTSYIADAEKLLPRRNLQILRPRYELGETVDADAVAGGIKAHLNAFVVDREADLVLALEWTGQPEYQRIREFARGIKQGLAERTRRGLPIYLVLDADIAKTLGSLLRDEFDVQTSLLVIDGLRLWDLDYIDLGAPLRPSNTVPVTIKSLLFSEASPNVRLQKRTSTSTRRGPFITPSSDYSTLDLSFKP